MVVAERLSKQFDTSNALECAVRVTTNKLGLKRKRRPAVKLVAAFFFSRGERIRTFDPLVPNQVR
jgi:hypothetical protein